MPCLEESQESTPKTGESLATTLYSILKRKLKTKHGLGFHFKELEGTWIRTSTSNESGGIKVFRKFQKGELAVGDWFCIPSETQNPVWFTLKERNGVGEESFQIFQIDSVKEYGPLMIGHEFDCFPKERIRDVKKWNWFLEAEGGQDREDDDVLGRKGKKGGRRKRRKGGGGDEDDDYNDCGVESEEDKEVVGKKRKVERVKKYSTRSKAGKQKPDGETKRKENYERRNRVCSNKDGGEDDSDDGNDDDDALGGFIVNDEEEDQEQESNEEEAFTDDDEEEEELDVFGMEGMDTSADDS